VKKRTETVVRSTPRTLRKKEGRLEDLAFALLGLLTACEGRAWLARCRRHWCLVLVPDSHGHGHVKDVLDAVLLFTTALHVHGAHLLGYSAALVGGDGREALCLEQLDAVLLVAQVGLEADEHHGRGGAEVEDLGVPLVELAMRSEWCTGYLPCP
jgi:hypothetical protein